MSDQPIYALHSGYVRSKNDGELHFIAAKELVDLYGLRRKNYVLVPHNAPMWRIPDGAIHLYPDPSGRYELPAISTEEQSK